uniref:Uncharacterized protein n=1 Tax=Oryza nivara TaxID=4536 RepID=A0A0E0FYZ9_ORYNI
MAGEEPARSEAGAELQEGEGGEEQAVAKLAQTQAAPSTIQAMASIIPSTTQAVAESEAPAAQRAEMEAMR